MAETEVQPPVETELDPNESTPEDVDPEEVDDSSLLDWQTTEPAAVKRPSSWYVIIGLVFAGIILAAILTRTWLFIPLGILVPVALAIYGQKGPGSHTYSLTPLHVVVDGKHHRYDEFKAFFEIVDQGQAVFELIPTQRFSTLVTLHAAAELEEDIVEILSSVLPETEPQGYLGESIFRRLRF